MGFIGFYIAISLLAFGLVGGELIKKFFPSEDLLIVAGACLIYYLPVDILVRYFFQKYPSIEVRPYLLLPIPRTKISSYLLLKSLLSFFNFMPVFVLVPFLLTGTLSVYPLIQIWSFIAFFFGMVVVSNYLSFWVTKGLELNNTWSGVILIGIFGITYLGFEGILPVFPTLISLSKIIFSNAFLPFIFLILAVVLFFWLKTYFSKKLYVQSAERSSVFTGAGMNLSWFGRFGLPGRLMDLELRLILRSKRARSYLLMSLLILFLPLATLADAEPAPDITYLFYALFMTGIIALNHGQLMLSWNALHFDLLLSRGIKIEDLFTAKYYFLVLTCFLTFFLSLPYLFIMPKLVLYNAVFVFFNSFFSIMIYMFLASYNSLRIDPNEGGAFSFSGFGMAHYLIGIPIMVVPIVLFYTGKFIGGESAGLMIIGVVGLAGVLAHKQIIKMCTKIFMSNRYKISAAFRKD